MRAAAKDAAPDECCGLLLGGEAIEEARPAANVATDPLRRFEIDPQSLVDAHRGARAGELQVIGYYHSHPAGPGEPSDTDRAMAPGDGKVWAIVAKSDVTFWRDDRDGFAPLPYAVEDR
jgi:desampylase